MNDVHALSGAYAVDAVDDIERAHFDKHLAECPDCRAEVASLREASALLASTVLAPAPATMRAEILADISTVRPLPPVIGEVTDRGRAARRRFPALVAAAAAVVALGAGSVIVQPWDNDRPAEVTVSAADRVFDAGDAESFTKIDKEGVSIAVARSAALDAAAIRTVGMPALPSDEVYQIWFQNDDDRVVNAGVMEQGNGEYILDGGDASDAAQVLITTEPAGGETRPTGSVVARIEFKQQT